MAGIVWLISGSAFAMLSRKDFLIRDDIVFLNHGSFGACPRPVFERYQAWQRELEYQPIEFLLRRRPQLMKDARGVIADYFKVPMAEIVFVTNATSGLNIALRSLRLAPGDEILTTDHEYGAVDRLLEFTAAKTGARIVKHQIRLPYESDQAFADAFFAKVSGNTKAIVVSHITSPTALILPVELISRRARESGIMTIIDGAHAPGQLPLDLAAIGADIYSGNFHKWLCAPKGAGFLHVQSQHHALIEPLVISHGWRNDSDFGERNDWGGTRDISAWLTVPAALKFLRQHDWESVRADCHRLAAYAQSQLCETFGTVPLSRDRFGQMVTIPLPECPVDALRGALYDDYHIEAPLGKFIGRCGVRVSVHAYNSLADIQQLIAALKAIII